MRYLRKTTLIGSAVAGALLLSSQAFAAPVTVDGINLDSARNFEVGSIYENVVSKPGQELSGFGQIDEINGNKFFCAGGAGSCELTFKFSGYTATDVTQSTIDFTGGVVNFYVDTAPQYGGNGQLFLSATGHTYLDTGSGRTGTLLAGGTNLNTKQPQGQGLGQLDVTGGDAAQYFNTNQINDFRGGYADLILDSSFAVKSACPPNGEPVCGSGDIHNTATAVPEPGELGLMGLGLLGLGFVFKRRRRS